MERKQFLQVSGKWLVVSGNSPKTRICDFLTTQPLTTNHSTKTKLGISLIAVLMFMLAATTASIVVFRWVGQENFASGARLKNTEAHQASQAGLEAVRGWMINNGADVGAVLRMYEKTGQPVRVNLGQVGGSKNQEFEVYLAGFEKGPTYKLKFIIEGTARDGSKYSQVGIFDVAGLYQISLTKSSGGGCTVDCPEIPALYVGGGNVDYGGTNRVSSVFINGDWAGNPPITDKDFVVTRDLKLSGNQLNVGGATCVGRDFSIQNNCTVLQNVYVGGDALVIGGVFDNLMVEGDLNHSNECDILVKENLTAGGTIKTNIGGKKFEINGNLVLGDELYLDAEPNERAFTVGGNAWIPGVPGVTRGVNNWHILGNNLNTSSVLAINNYTRTGGPNGQGYCNYQFDGTSFTAAGASPSGTGYNPAWCGTKNCESHQNNAGLWCVKHACRAEWISRPNREGGSWCSYYEPVWDADSSKWSVNGNYNGDVWSDQYNEPKWDDSKNKWCLYGNNCLDDMPRGVCYTDPEVESQVCYNYEKVADVPTNPTPSSYQTVNNMPRPNSLSNLNNSGCMFVSDFSRVYYASNGTSQLFVNGTNLSPNDFPCGFVTGSYCSSALPPKVDGGYYIRLNGGSLNNQPNFRSKDCSAISTAGTRDFDGADAALHECNEIWMESSGCNGERFVIEDIMKTADLDVLETKFANNVCTGINSPKHRVKANADINQDIDALNTCYKTTAKSNLYNEKYLVINMEWDGNASPTTRLDGNFVFIFPDAVSASQFRIPPTTQNSRVLVYLKQGATGMITPTNNTCNSSNFYNYFIYSLRTIAQINGFTSTCPINGTVYMPRVDPVTKEPICDDGTLKVQSTAVINQNAELIEDLMAAEVICRFGDDNCGRGGVLPSSSSGAGGSSSSTTTIVTNINDEFYIPLTPNLKVSLQSQYVNKESTAGNEAEPSILGLPRVINVPMGTTLPTINGATGGDKYYNVLYLNGAKRATSPSEQVSCASYDPDVKSTYECTLAVSGNSTCGSNCQTPIWIKVIDMAGAISSSSDGSSSSEEASSSSEASLSCSNLTLNATEGSSISPPMLTCSNGNEPTGVSWSPAINWENPMPGTYSNITATGDCGDGVIASNVCGTLQVAYNTTLSCAINGSNSKIAVGVSVPNPSISPTQHVILTCSKEGPATNDSYSNINWGNPAVGEYSNIQVTADCGPAMVSATCTGTLTVVGVTCTGLPPFVGVEKTIPAPSVKCNPADADATGTFVWAGRPSSNTSWTIPAGTPGGTSYSIGMSNAICDGVTDLSAPCGTVMASAITCSGLPATVQKGEQIPAPTLICTGGTAAQGVSYKTAGEYVNVPYTNTTTVGAKYKVGGTAHCSSNISDTHLRDMAFECSQEVEVTDLPSCDFQQSWCPGIAWADIKTGSFSASSSSQCYFVSNITNFQPHYNNAALPITINGQVHGSCNSCSGLPTKADGGYYIYVTQTTGSYYTSWTNGTKPTNCAPPDYVPPSSSSAVPSSSSVAPSSSSSAGGCQYQPSWCGGIAFESVIKNDNRNGNSSLTSPGCYFVTKIDNHQLNGGDFTVNGTTVATCNCAPNLSGVTKADGGYYVYVASGNGNTWWTSWTGGTPVCGGGGL